MKTVKRSQEVNPVNKPAAGQPPRRASSTRLKRPSRGAGAIGRCRARPGSRSAKAVSPEDPAAEALGKILIDAPTDGFSKSDLDAQFMNRRSPELSLGISDQGSHLRINATICKSADH